ncbi:aldehyde dehydrogenase (NAD+) [Fusarium phyllophilum]|uniref:Beta-apo-4'-carotenal oxygenase n=1 Tax=Fusarium phyllophilum TaxID=47803 RepID=A0A8H5K777_9HYPO|nr:aldehyde dehydrogenase (NAD+) [Fusarium phyllophilum]
MSKEITSPRPYTSEEEFLQYHSQLFKTFATGKTKSIKWRKWQLKQMWWMLVDNEKAITEALAADLGRHEFEARTSDLHGLKTDILEHLNHVEEWAADEPVSSAGFLMGTLGKARIRKEPLGVVLVIGAWNFPFLLTFQPVIAAITAGCCAVVKPSELSVASQNLMQDLVARYLDPEAIRVVTGGPQETTKLLELKFNHIFFTGSTKVAKFVAAAAAKHLTPTVLELGGQGPSIVTARADLDLAAKRIAYAKFLNAGQICLSVNHVFVDPEVHDAFVKRLHYWTQHFSGGESSHMCKIVNKRNFERLSGLLKGTSGKVFQASVKEGDNMLSPTVVTYVRIDDSLLSEELFGPICPVIRATYKDAIRETNSGPHPLAIYIFSSDRSEIDYVLQKTISGGVTVNDFLMHYGVPGGPFGGVGDSGQGYYHGKYGFMAFTRQRTILEIPTWMDRLMEFRYPPFDMKNMSNFVVKNSLGFRRGEAMEDQVIGGSRSWVWAGLEVLVASAIGVAVKNPDSFRTMLPPNTTNYVSSLLSEAHELSQPLLDGLSGSPLTIPISLASAIGLGYLANKILVSRALNHGTEAYFDWNKEIVLVTGGSGGIGGETVQQLASKGICVVVLDVLALTYKAPSNVYYYKCDLTNYEQLQEVAGRIRREVGEPTIVVANAGVCRGKPLLKATKQDVERTIGVNTLGLIWTIKAFLPAMVSRNHGHLLIVASQTGYLATVGITDYAASKSAAIAIYEGLHTEIKHVHKATAVRLSCVSPSHVQTQMFTGVKSVPGMSTMTTEYLAGKICGILLSGRGQNIIVPAAAGMSPWVRVLPGWVRVLLQDAAAPAFTDLKPHDPFKQAA